MTRNAHPTWDFLARRVIAPRFDSRLHKTIHNAIYEREYNFYIIFQGHGRHFVVLIESFSFSHNSSNFFFFSKTQSWKYMPSLIKSYTYMLHVRNFFNFTFSKKSNLNIFLFVIIFFSLFFLYMERDLYKRKKHIWTSYNYTNLYIWLYASFSFSKRKIIAAIITQ